MKELHHRMKQTRLHASKYNTIYRKEASVGAFIRTGPLIRINSVFKQVSSLLDS